MKSKLQHIWDNLITGGFVVAGCALMFAIVVGGIWGCIELVKWLWSFNWFKSSISSIGYFISDNSQILEYIFVGGFLLYLLGCIVFGIVTIIRDNKLNIINFSKAAWNLFLKILAILFILIICFFCLRECFHNSPDIEPQLYEHRM